MQRFPFIRTNRALCCDPSVLANVNGRCYAAYCPSDASGLTVIEILLAVNEAVSVCGMINFSRTDYSVSRLQ